MQVSKRLSAPQGRALPRRARDRKVTRSSVRAPREEKPTASGAGVLETIASVVQKHRLVFKGADEKDEWVVVNGKATKRTPVDSPTDALPVLKLLKGILFARDMPMRVKTGFTANLTTTAAGVLNVTWQNSSIGSVTEWSSLSSLFDEIFIHGFTVHVRLFNQGSTVHPGASTAAVYPTQAGSNGQVYNTGLQYVSLFNGGGTYSTADAMLANPSLKFKHSSSSHSYTWRNNVKFEKHGLAISSSTSEAFQGWTLMTNAANIGGIVQVRATGDPTIGDGTHASVLGRSCVIWDFSLRARS